jgi:transcriptional regulator of acetoin/glycerol metabolism
VVGSDDSTLRLFESSADSVHGEVTAVRWVCPGAPATYTVLDREVLGVGRGKDADVRLEAGGVSRVHAKFSRRGPIFALSDEGSTNGTHVNGQPIADTAVSPGDVLRFGDMLGVVVRAKAELDPAAPDTCELLPGLLFGPGLQAALSTLARVAATELPVVIEGETGTGKECAARALHALSGRVGPLHAINCAAVISPLAESELFGHRKGAFTGADRAALGHIRAADTGTLVLDEFAELPLGIQAKLLRVIQEREVTPVGETRAIGVDVRLVTTIQQPLAQLVESGRLRADLAMRVDGICVKLPPLRCRRQDVAVLFAHLLHRHSGGRPPSLDPLALEALLLHDWPGNVRELEQVARWMLVLHGHERSLRRQMLPGTIGHVPKVALQVPASAGAARYGRAERDLLNLAQALAGNGANLARAAEAVGISRQRAYRLLRGRTSEQLMTELGLSCERKDKGLGDPRH